jgi:hypothetical protein
MKRVLIFASVVGGAALCFFLGHRQAERVLIAGQWWPCCSGCGTPLTPDVVERIRARGGA